MSFAQDTKGCCQVRSTSCLPSDCTFLRSFASGMVAMAAATNPPSMRAAGNTQLATRQYVCEASQIYDSKEEKMIVFIKLFSMLCRTDFTLYFLAPN